MGSSFSLRTFPSWSLHPEAPSALQHPSPEQAPSLSGSHPGCVGALTPGHLDELGDTEHSRGDEALLEVSCVCNRERMGISGSVSLSGHPGTAQTPGGGPSLARRLATCEALRWQGYPAKPIHSDGGPTALTPLNRMFLLLAAVSPSLGIQGFPRCSTLQAEARSWFIHLVVILGKSLPLHGNLENGNPYRVV